MASLIAPCVEERDSVGDDMLVPVGFVDIALGTPVSVGETAAAVAAVTWQVQ
jgi:hypothetical protein